MAQGDSNNQGTPLHKGEGKDGEIGRVAKQKERQVGLGGGTRENQ